MANTSKLSGFRPVKHTNGSPYNGGGNIYCTLASYGTALQVGDPAVLGGSGHTNGIASIQKAGQGTSVLGVITGILPTKMDPVSGTMTGGSISGISSLAVSGAITATGNITAYYSDERLKAKLGNINNAVNKISQLNGFYYTNNELANSFGYTDTKTQLGLSAQEVQSVFPDIVSLAPFDRKENTTDESKSGENYLTIDYSKLVPVLVEAIKELKAEIEELKRNK